MAPWVRTQYHQAIARAEYYRWSAQRKFPVSRDPLTGLRPRREKLGP